MYLDEDRAVWKTYKDKAEEEAKQVADGYAKLLEEQKKALENYLLESQKKLLEIPELIQPEL